VHLLKEDETARVSFKERVKIIQLLTQSVLHPEECMQEVVWLATKKACIDKEPGLGPKCIEVAVGVWRSLFCCAMQAECVEVQVSSKLLLSGLLSSACLCCPFWLASLPPDSL
jgi:hypothetical protein